MARNWLAPAMTWSFRWITGPRSSSIGVTARARGRPKRLLEMAKSHLRNLY